MERGPRTPEQFTIPEIVDDIEPGRVVWKYDPRKHSVQMGEDEDGNITVEVTNLE